MGDAGDRWGLGEETPPTQTPPGVTPPQGAPPAQGPAWTPVQGAVWTPPPPFVPVFGDSADKAATWVPHVFHHARRLALIACGLLGASGILALAEAIHFIIGVELQGRLNVGQSSIAETDSFNQTMVNLAMVGLVLSLVCGIAFMRWLWRSVGNATELDAGYGISSPRGTVVAWIIPIYNLFRPYQIVIDLHDRLLAPLASQTGRWLIRFWWAFWLGGSIVGYALVFGMSGDSGPNRVVRLAALVVSSAVTFADAILAIAVVRQLQRLADAREIARAGDPARAIDLVTASQRPRVTRLPLALAGVVIFALAVPLGVTYSSASKAPSWPIYNATGGSFSVSFPTTPSETPISQSASGLTLTGKSLKSGIGGDRLFELDYLDFPSGTLGTADASAVFDLFEESFPSTVTIESRSDITVDGRPARELRGSGSAPSTGGGTTQVAVRVWFCVDEDRFYFLEGDAAPGQADSPDIDRFLNSFKLN